MILLPLVQRLIGPTEPLFFQLAEYLPWYHHPYVSTARPIVVGGCGRSGTTLMRVILDTHSQICCGPETGLLCYWRPRGFFVRRVSQAFDMQREQIRQLIARTRGHAEFVDRFFQQVCEKNQAAFWAEKTPRNVHSLPYIFKHFPQARFIHMIRDGRDTVCSLRHHPRFRTVNGKSIPTNINNPLSGCVRRWVKDVRQGLKYRHDSRYFEIRYEDLVQDGENTLRRLFQFLELPWENRVLDFHRVKSEMRDVTRFPQNPEAVRPLYKSAVGRWQTDLSLPECEYFKNRAGDLLIELGYADNFSW